MSGRCTRNDAGTSSPPETALGSSMRISWDNVPHGAWASEWGEKRVVKRGVKSRVVKVSQGLTFDRFPAHFSPQLKLCTLWLHYSNNCSKKVKRLVERSRVNYILNTHKLTYEASGLFYSPRNTTGHGLVCVKRRAQRALWKDPAVNISVPIASSLL